MSNVVKGGPFGWIKRLEEDTPEAPPAIDMPTMDSEAIRRARLREMRKMVANTKGRESTMLGGAQPKQSKPVAPQSATLGGV